MVTKTEIERLTVVETDTKWMKEQFKEVVPKINEMHNTFLKGEGKISTLNKAVYGNGQPGLIRIVDELCDINQQRLGKSKLINAAIGGGWLLTILLFILSMVDKI